MSRLIHAPDQGASSTEYATVLVLVAAITVAVITAGYPRQVADLYTSAMDCVVGTEGCEPGSGGPGDSDPGEPDNGGDSSDSGGGPDTTGTEPVRYDLRGQDDGPRRSYECGSWQRLCDWGQGAASETNDIVIDTWEGAQGTACLVHICDNDDFRATWGGLRDSVVATASDPAGAVQDAYYAWADGPIEDYDNAYDDRSAGRTVVLGAASVFGFGLTRFLPTKPRGGTGNSHLDGAIEAAARGDTGAAQRHADQAERAAEDSETAAEANPDDLRLEMDAATDRTAADLAARQVSIAQAREILLSTPSGRKINRLLNRQGIEVDFSNRASDANAYGMYLPGQDAILLNPRWEGEPQSAITLAHEAHHAGSHSSLPTVHEATKAEYATAHLRDEAEAQVAGFEFADELRDQGYEIPPYPVEETYRSLYDDALQRHRDDGLSDRRARARAKEDATDALADNLGESTMSNGSTYREMYEAEWDTLSGN